MKKYIFFLLFVVTNVNSVFSQKYREIFDMLDSQDDGLTSLSTNINYKINGYNTRALIAYLNMFKATNDIRYLNKFVITAKRMQDRRDDNISTAEVIDLPTGVDWDGDGILDCPLYNKNEILASKAWSVFDGNKKDGDDGGCFTTQTFKEAGEICIPMAEFILMLKTDYSSFQYSTLPDEVNSSTASVNNYSGMNVTNYIDFANWLEIRIKETITWFDNSYNASCVDDEAFCLLYSSEENCCHQPEHTPSGYSYYQFTNHNTGGINQQLYMGTLLAYMYQISVIEGSSTSLINLQYLFKLKNMLHDFMYHITNIDGVIGGTSQPVVDNGENAYVWCHSFDCLGGANGYWEDVAHAVIDIQFADACYKFNIPRLYGGYLTLSDMRKFSNTFAYKIVNNPLSFHKNVYGTDIDCDQLCGDTPDDNGAPSSYGFLSTQYTFLTEYNPQIYQIISDFYSPDNIANYDIGNSMESRLGYSYLALYENLFNPITVKRGVTIPSSGTSYYSGACNDYIDGDANTGFVSSKIFDFSGTSYTLIEEQNLNNNNDIIVLNTFTKADAEIGMLSNGNIIQTNSGEEVLAIDSKNSLLEIFTIQSGSLVNLFQTPVSSLGIALSDIKGTIVGDFNTSYSGDEIILSSKQSGVPIFKMYSYDAATSSLINIPISNNIITAASIDGFCYGNFDITGENQIALYENSSNKIIIYKIISGNILQEVTSGILNTPGEEWKGITSGDFDGDGIDEIILYQESNDDSRFQICRLTTSGIELKAEEFTPTNQKNGVMCSTRLPSYPQNEALITFRSYDGQVSVFNMDGFCPGLNLNSQTINENTTIDDSLESATNNYTIDYHVNNTLIVGNGFDILDPSIVDMSSGKEIHFVSGFSANAGCDLHAYIEPALECTPSTFRKSTPPPPNNESQTLNEIKQIKQIAKGNISINPNPNNGSFQISITRNEKPIAIKEIKVYDIMGKVVWQNDSSKDNVFTIDITGYAQGIYYVKSINEFDEMEMKKLVKQ